MPVKFEAQSEYDRAFKWLQSRRSAEFEASKQEDAPVAGAISSSIGVSADPPIQRRKKPVGAHSPVRPLPSHDAESICTVTEDDFFLLGDTSKFANNVQYRNSRKALEKSMRRGKTYKINTKPSTDVNRDPITFDAQPPEQKPGKPFYSEKPVQTDYKPRDLSKTVPVRLVEKSGTKRSHAGKPRHPDKSQPIPKQTPPKKTPLAPRAEKNVVMAIPPVEKSRDNVSKSQFVHNEEKTASKFVQAAAPSKPEKTQDLALQYRAGMKPSRPSSIKRLSEYQKQFQWKEAVHSSPLLAADQMVFKSASVLRPHVSLPRHSEYQTQFQSPPKDVYVPSPVTNPKPDPHSPSKRSKPEEGDLIRPSTAHESAPASRHNLTDKDKRQLHEAVNPQKPFPPHGKHRRSKSEYARNFQAPHNYIYHNGVWKAVKASTEPVQQATANVCKHGDASWYQEVVELRQKADEYRKRALGTHFSRMHTAQVLAKNADLWDDESSAESRTISALSLETASQASSRTPRPSGIQGVNGESETGSFRAPPVVKQAWSKDLSPSLSSVSRRSLYGSDDTETVEDTPRDPPRDQLITDDQSPDSDDEGRIPTPRLQPVQRRHHLDVTTPAVGGALLTSPAPKQLASRIRSDADRERSHSRQSEDIRQTLRLVSPQKALIRQHHRHGYELDAQCTCGVDDHVEEVKPKAKTTKPKSAPASAMSQSKSRARAVTPTFGKRTSDCQPLLDEEADVDRVLTTKYLASPLIHSHDHGDRHVPIYGVNIPRTLDERFGDTYITPTRYNNQEGDDDAESVASTCSLASETLERAINRREFWARDLPTTA